jgi:hypothetical protein
MIDKEQTLYANSVPRKSDYGSGHSWSVPARSCWMISSRSDCLPATCKAIGVTHWPNFADRRSRLKHGARGERQRYARGEVCNRVRQTGVQAYLPMNCE